MKTIHLSGDKLSPMRIIGEQLPNLRWQISHINGLRRRHDVEPMTDIFQLTDIPWPAKARQQIDRSIGEPLRIRPQTARAGAQEMSGQQGHILRPFTQGRQAKTDDIQSMKQVFAKQTLPNTGFEGLMRGCNHSYIRAQW